MTPTFKKKPRTPHPHPSKKTPKNPKQTKQKWIKGSSISVIQMCQDNPSILVYPSGDRLFILDKDAFDLAIEMNYLRSKMTKKNRLITIEKHWHSLKKNTVSKGESCWHL